MTSGQSRLRLRDDGGSSAIVGVMPLIDVTYVAVGEEVLHRLAEMLRPDLIRDRLSALPLGQVGVWLILPEGAWS
jgi:hypothetical protein